MKDSGRRTRGEGGKKNSGVIGKDSELVDHVLDQNTEEAFDKVVANLNTLGVTTEDCDLNDGQGYSFFPYSKFAQYSPAYDWCFLIKYDVLRKCFLIECKLSEGEFFYLMDVQRRLNNKKKPKEHGFMVVFESKEDRRKLVDSELNEFLSHVALKEAVLKDMKGYEGLRFHGIKHLRDDTSETRAERIISKIKSGEKNEL
ncbi:MAG: hypothetical protein JST48_10680 [Bacteroidetes bacterium]|nr:hypothetical protein [Bacteroidota bacterium]